jgi:hypothetical protein
MAGGEEENKSKRKSGEPKKKFIPPMFRDWHSHLSIPGQQGDTIIFFRWRRAVCQIEAKELNNLRE